MSKKIDLIVALIFISIVVILLGVIGFRSPINFDSAYNLLSYQSLFNGDGFRYHYDAHDVYFDPTISTGPELYFPVYVVWKILGKANYELAVLVFLLYIIALLFLIFFIILRNFQYKSLAILFFVSFIITNQNIINDHILWNPLGELVSIFFIVSGFYLLSKQKYIIGPLLLGFALDVKTNIIVALVPTIFIYYIVEYYIPLLKQKKYIKIAKISFSALLVFVPFIFYKKILPFITLNSQQYSNLVIERQNRMNLMLNRGFGQLIDLKNELNSTGVEVFLQIVKNKINILMQFFHINNYFLLILFFGVLFYLLIISYKNKLLSFYLFLFSMFIAFWWIFATIDPWYRYFVIADILVIIGIILMFPFFLKQYNNRKRFFIVFLFSFIIFLFVGRFSYSSIQNVLNDKTKYDMIKMVNYIDDNNINEDDIFTYGWFQAPQIMFLTNKRFNSLLSDKENKDGKYYLETIENTIVKNEVEPLENKFLLIYKAGYNKLFIIKNYDK